jgi:prepilin-type processing-associated H-X9-DG protein
MNFTVPAYAESIPENSASDVPAGWSTNGERGPAVVTTSVGPNPNRLAAFSQPKVYVCPSAWRAKPMNEFKDYALAYDNNPAGENCCPERRPVGSRGPFTGMGWVNSEIRMADVIDGTSSTCMIVEKAHVGNQSWCSDGKGCNQFFWVHHQSQGFVYATRPPNSTLGNSRAALSLHPGGLNASFVDGHVSFIKNSIDMATYRAMFSRAGGEVISGDY